MINKGTWVQIHKIILTKDERAPQLPNDTKQVPLEMWVKGTLLEDGDINSNVKIKTITGRIEEGKLVAVNPTFKHNYGDFIPEILKVSEIVRDIMYGDDFDA